MTNPYPSGSPGVPDSSMPTGASALMPRRSSYASVVSGAAQQYAHPSRSGAFAHLLNQPFDPSYDPPHHNNSGHSRYDSRAFEMDFNTNGSSYDRSGSWGRGGPLPSFSSAFGLLARTPDLGAFGGGHMDHFFVPSYLRDSKFVQKLEEVHKAKILAQKDGPSAHSSQPGSLSTSASSINLHSKMATSHRGMAYDIIEKAPPLEDEVLPPLPSRWNSHDKYGGLEVMSDGQEVKFTGAKSPSDRDHEACAIRADHPMPSQCGVYYFEVTIISKRREESSIGIGFSGEKVPLSRLPGWEPDSWAYHGDDGHSFCCQSSGKHYGPPFTAGDIIGCGVNFKTGSAFFTKNGDHLGTAFREIKGKLFPSVGMKKTGEHIRVNFGQSPFVFDIDGLMAVSSNIPLIFFMKVYFEFLPFANMDSSSGSDDDEDREDTTPLLSPEETALAAARLAREAAIEAAASAAAMSAAALGVSPLLRTSQYHEAQIRRHAQEVEALQAARAASEAVARATQDEGEAQHHVVGEEDSNPLGRLSSGRIFGSLNSHCQSCKRARTNADSQDEKRSIRMQIEATSTSKLAPKLNETELIQQLVLQFLQHDGYVETARAFAEEVHAEKKALSLDPDAAVNGFDVKEDEDAGHRQRIRAAILEGDVERALKYTNVYYPHVLKDNEHVYFRLKCLRFIELNRQGAEMLNHATPPTSNGIKKAGGHHNAVYYEDYVDHGMEFDDQHQSSNWDRMDTEEPGSSPAEYTKLMEETLLYGQQLQAEFKDDPRREVKKALDDVFSLMAYPDPFNSKEVSYLLDPSGRLAVAEELNSAILLSLGKSSSAALEQLYQQTTVLLEDLRDGGGPGAFVNIDDYVHPNTSLSRY